MRMIDIHCHLLFGVDDGSDSLNESRQMLARAKEQGVRKIILTPHYRHGMFPYRLSEILENFYKLEPYAKKMGIDLFLGCEYHMDSSCVEKLGSGRCLTMADSHYVLTEYSHICEYSYIYSTTEEMIRNGYRPVIAHIERYPAITDHPERVKELRRLGAMIQVNADSVLGYEGRAAKKFCKKFLKEGDIDIVASDSHGIQNRVCNLGECRTYILRKYGAEAVKQVLYRNPSRILRDK